MTDHFSSSYVLVYVLIPPFSLFLSSDAVDVSLCNIEEAYFENIDGCLVSNLSQDPMEMTIIFIAIKNYECCLLFLPN